MLVCVQAGVIAIVDGAHAIGNVPLDIPTLGAHVYVTNCHKWLCAPKGTALLWAHPSIQPSLAPLVHSHGHGLGFVGSHLWTGTADICNWLAVPAALRLFTQCGLAYTRAHQLNVLHVGLEMLVEACGCAFNEFVYVFVYVLFRYKDRGEASEMRLTDRLTAAEQETTHEFVFVYVLFSCKDMGQS